MRTALFVFSIVNYYREMLPVARHFRDHGWRVQVMIGWAGGDADAATALCQAEHFEIFEITKRFLLQAAAPPPAADVASPATEADEAPRRASERQSLVTRLRSFASSLAQLLRIRRYAARLVGKLRPDVVFFGPFHSPNLLHNGLIRAYRRAAIPVCCLPVSAYLGERNSVLGRFSNRKLGMLGSTIEPGYDRLNRVFARLAPGWTRTHDGQTLFMWDPLLMLASRLTGLLERNPWQKPSTLFDRVYVYSDFSARMLTSTGYDAAKICICGIPLLDTVCRAEDPSAARSALHGALGFDGTEDYILFNVEPAAEHHYASWADHRRRFRQTMELLARFGKPVVLSLHPLCAFEEYRFVTDVFGFVVAREQKIFDLYPYCRFVVSFPCSTNVLAARFGKRLIIYDFYGIASEESPRKDLFRLDGALVGDDLATIAQHIAATIAETPERTIPAADDLRPASEIVLDDVTSRFLVGVATQSPGTPNSARSGGDLQELVR